MTKTEVFAKVQEEIEHWNSVAQDMFKLSPVDEDLNFSGIIRFYYKSPTVGYSSKCVRVDSGWSVERIIGELTSKFSETIHCNPRTLSLFQCHFGEPDKLLDDKVLPLFLQLRWLDQGLPEGRFVLKQKGMSDDEDYSYIDLPPKIKGRTPTIRNVVHKIRTRSMTSKRISHALSEDQICGQLTPSNPLTRAFNDSHAFENISPLTSPSHFNFDDSKDLVVEMDENDVYSFTDSNKNHLNDQHENMAFNNKMKSEYDRLNQSMNSLYSELSSSDDGAKSKGKKSRSGSTRSRNSSRHSRPNRSESLENLQRRTSGLKSRPLPKVDLYSSSPDPTTKYPPSSRELFLNIPEDRPLPNLHEIEVNADVTDESVC